MFKLGLTGSIGMGKSTTAQMFVDEGCALWDADAAVHRLYAKGGAAVSALASVFPKAIQNGAIDRGALRSIISQDEVALKRIEEIVHPLVAQDRLDFAATTTADILVLDIPLLFETGADKQMDAVVCVSIPREIQKKRVMERGTMTAAQFDQILAKQLPNEEKMSRSDFIVVTDTVEHARAQVQDIVGQIREKLKHA